MTVLRVGALGALVCWLFATGCSSASYSTAPGRLELRGTYVAAGPGAYVKMTFYDPEHYFLFKSPCDTSDPVSANACMESGTYALNPTQTILALREVRTGAITELTFSVGSLMAVPSSAGLKVRGEPLTSGNGTSLTTGSGTPITTGSGTMLAAADASLVVADGGALAFGDGGSLTGGDAGSAVASGYNANGQPFSQTGMDAGTALTMAGDAGAAPSTSGMSGSGSGGGSMPGSGAGSMPSSGAPTSTDAGGASMDAGMPTGPQIDLLYEGTCNYLKQCDSYSRKAPAGQVAFGCFPNPVSCSDSDPYLAGPNKSYCGQTLTLCTSNGTCTNATVKDTSNVHGWEGGLAVMQALGLGHNDGTCRSGGSGGGTVTLVQQ